MIYITPFNTTTKQATSASSDSGFSTIQEVRDVMGEPTTDGKRIVIYDDVAFSEYPCYIDSKDNKGE